MFFLLVDFAMFRVLARKWQYTKETRKMGIIEALPLQFQQDISGGKTMTATTNTVAKTRTNEQTAVSVQAEISRGAVATMGATGAVVGPWSFASLVVTGGPISPVQSWFGAAFGM